MVCYCYFFVFAFLGSIRAVQVADSTILLVAAAVVFLCLVTASDLRTRQIKNSTNLYFLLSAVTALGISLAWDVSAWALLRACLSGALLFIGFWAIHIASSQGLGGGDVKLAPALGVVLGSVSWSAVWLGVFLAFLLNGLAALVVLLVSRTAQGSIPFAPALGCGTLLGLLLG